MKQIIYLDEMEEKSNDLVSFCEKDIKNKMVELQQLMQDVDWRGSSHDLFMEKYNTACEEMLELNDQLKLLGEYLKTGKDFYFDTTSDVTKKWNNYYDEIR